MSRLLYIISSILIILTTCLPVSASSLVDKTGKKPIVITANILTADNKNNTAVFEGNVVAKSDDIAMYSDKMTVLYDGTAGKINKILATGNVKVNQEDKAIFSDEAVYYNAEEKIVFKGSPRAVEAGNVITGTQIIFFLKDDRAVIEGSKVVLQNTKGLK